MSFLNPRSGLIAAAILVRVGMAQTQVDLATQSKSVNFSSAPFTRPVKTGTSQPSTCTVGDLFFNTAAPAGQNLYACVGTNSWSLETGGGGGSSPAGSTGDLQRNNSGILGVANLSQNADGSLNASAAVNQAVPSVPTYNVGSTTICDLSKSTVCQLNATGATTLAATNPHGSGPYTFVTVTDSNGPYTISLPSAFHGAPPFSVAASSTLVATCLYDGVTNYTCGYTEAPSVLRLTTERALPGAPLSGLACVPDSTGHMLRCINSSGTTFAVAKDISGIRKGNGTNAVDTTAAAADVVGLFSGCSGTQYLGADGACHTASGGSGSTNTTPWITPFGASDTGSSTTLPQNGAIQVFAVTFGSAIQMGKLVLGIVASGGKHGAWAVYSLGGSQLATGTAVSLCGGCEQVFTLGYTAAAGTYYLAFSTDDTASGTYERTTANFVTSLVGSVTTPMAAMALNTVTWSSGAATWPATLGTLTGIPYAAVLAVTY